MRNRASETPIIEPSVHARQHVARTIASPFRPAASDLIRVGSRRWFLQTGLAGVSGRLAFPQMLAAKESRAQAPAAAAGHACDRKAVILFWLSGGPSHIDMWDPKPESPAEIRGPYSPISTCVPGIQVCEHLPLQAWIANRLSFLRAVDCRASNHTPITMQSGNPLARRTDDGKDGAGYPSMGSIAAKFRGANRPEMPPFVGLAPSWVSDVWEAGKMGSAFAPVKGLELVGRFSLPKDVHIDRLQDREALRQSFDRFRRDLDRGDLLEKTDRYNRRAFEMVRGGLVERAFDLKREPAAARDRYGRTSIGEKAILARRLVEAGVTFVLISGAWGYFDHHGDNVVWGGIRKGLTPILPTVDRALWALVTDLSDRGLLDSTLVLMLGEFGRSPVINKDAGRDHWTNVMSMVMAGGGLKHGQTVGSTDRRGYDIKDGRVSPQDLAATVFQHLGVDLSGHWTNPEGRPIPIVVEGGRPIPELI